MLVLNDSSDGDEEIIEVHNTDFSRAGDSIVV